MNLVFDEAKLKELIDKLDKEILNIESYYKAVDEKMSNLDGKHEIWKSDTQQTVYDYYEEIKKDFPDSIQNIKNYSEFLKKTLENYSNSIKTNDKDVDDNGDNLNIN